MKINPFGNKSAKITYYKQKIRLKFYEVKVYIDTMPMKSPIMVQ